MDTPEIENTVTALCNVAAILTERQRQVSQTGNSPHRFVADSLLRESTRLQLNGQSQLAAGVLALLDQIEAMENE